jgi:hypothetical protein
MHEAHVAAGARSFAGLRWSNRPGLLIGVLLPLGLAVLSFWIGTLVSGSARHPPLAPIIFNLSIGLSQIIYVLPLHLWARHQGWSRFVRGLWAGAIAVLVINAALWADALLNDR